MSEVTLYRRVTWIIAYGLFSKSGVLQGVAADRCPANLVHTRQPRSGKGP